jgi:hypothetical protein
MKTIELYDKIDNTIITTEDIDDDRWPNAVRRYRGTAYLRNREAGEDRYEGREKPAQPFASWTYDDGTWTAPVPRPTETAQWDEDAQGWVEPA